jgi:Predicted membrane protein (DUF2207)
VRWLGGALAALVLAAGAALPAAAAAQGEERILDYHVDLLIRPDGVLRVSERIDYDFGAAERHGIFRDLPVRSRHDGRIDRLYPVEALSVDASADTPHQYRVTDEGDLLRIRVGDPDRTVSGRHAYTIAYQVRGALDGFADHDELYWNAVGTQWRVPIVRASATVTAPAAISHLACHAGQPDAWRSCASSRVDGRTANFAATDLGPAEGLAVGVGFPTGVVPAPRPVLQERWSLARAFAVTPATLGMAGLLAALLVLGWLVGTAARDRRQRQRPGAAASVEAEPPEGVRPAQASLLLDREVRPAAVAATVVDLAVRG